MSYFYAQINENNVCYNISSLSGEVSDVSLIRIQNFDTNLLGRKYADGQWLDALKPEESIIPEPAQLDRIEAAINMKNEEISENAIDTYTKQLLESGLL